MGHGGGTDLSGFDFLFEVGHRDVSPKIAVKVDDDGVDATQVVKHGGEIVVVGDLGRELFPFDVEFFGQEIVGERCPVNFGVCDVVGVEIPCGTSEFAGASHFL